MDNEKLLELYQYSLFKKLSGMQDAEQCAYMSELFGRRWLDVYGHLTNIYPQMLDAPNENYAPPATIVPPFP